jgi:hypothetical protein
MIPPAILAFVILYLLVLNFYIEDERSHAQGQCSPHRWQYVKDGWVCEHCRLCLTAN